MPMNQPEKLLPDSGFRQLLGFELTQWSADQAVVELDIGPQHLNLAGVLHGGVLTALIDVACGFAGCWSADPQRPRRCVTLSLTTSFTAQASGGRIRAVGRKRAGGRRIFAASCEVFDAGGQLLAFGEGTLRYRSGSEEAAGPGAGAALNDSARSDGGSA
ncbi:uncharacterized protein (TIGR00369 family) [Plasticicumulans acidivorans]|uniref:Uncharacterized protein (TIGR00369 family) n=2 Tax=Plasticicumulans acidivorans TaxID=886464 RepID=A0A317MMV6_9GAMM|nr:uncharacterized protein (TIGR00369 family) [Plasticicumulans acidivorans]